VQNGNPKTEKVLAKSKIKVNIQSKGNQLFLLYEIGLQERRHKECLFSFILLRVNASR